MAHWYTADPHFGHDNIITFCKRPFADSAGMDDALLANYAACVRPDDDFWIVGDFAFGRAASRPGYLERIFAAVPGRKHLITGNHDHKAQRKLGWASVQDIAEVKDGDHAFVLFHYPMITWPGSRHGSISLFGHVHDNWPGSRNCVNVGVDVWDFQPIQAQAIAKRAAELPVNPLWHTLEPGTGWA